MLYSSLAPRMGEYLPRPSVDAVFVRGAAIDALELLSDAVGPAYPALLTASKDSNAHIRGKAIYLLNTLSDREPEIRAALNRLIKPGLSHMEVVKLVNQFHLQGPSATKALIVALKDEQVETRKEALFQLRIIGRGAKEATPDVLRLLKDRDRFVRAEACQTLGAMKPEAMQIIPALVLVLDDTESWVRGNAAETLGLCGKAAQAAVPKLVGLVNVTNNVERYRIRKALSQIDPVAAAKLAKE